MKLFGGSSNQPANGQYDTLIGQQTEILGDVRFSGGLHVDGRIRGNVLAASDKAAVLSISQQGLVEGDVRVPNIVLNGTVTGDVHASERITIAAHGRVTGNVYYKVLEMASGATVNGQLLHEGDEELAAISHVRDAEPEANDAAAEIQAEAS